MEPNNINIGPPVVKLSRVCIVSPTQQGGTVILDVVGFSLTDVKDELREFDPQLARSLDTISQSLVLTGQQRRELTASR
jgi:hypothetical protein